MPSKMKIHWEHKKGKLRKKFSGIREKDLDYTIGRENELLRKLREKLGKSDAEILAIIIDL
jgi:hypothetical protein